MWAPHAQKGFYSRPREKERLALPLPTRSREPGAKGDAVVCLPGGTPSTLQPVSHSVSNPDPRSQHTSSLCTWGPDSLHGWDMTARESAASAAPARLPSSAPQGTAASLCHQLWDFFPSELKSSQMLTPQILNPQGWLQLAPRTCTGHPFS